MQQLARQLQTPEPAPPWGLLAGLGAMVAAFLMIAIVGGVVAFGFFEAGAAGALVTGWAVGGALTIMFVLVTRSTPEDRAALRLDAAGLPPLIAFGIGLGGAVTLDLIAIPIAGEVLRPPELIAFSQQPGLTAWVFGALFMLAVQPAAEELVFRGVLFPALRAAQGLTAALAVSSLFYGIFHQLAYPHPAPDAGGVWYGLIEPTLLGVLLGLVRAASGSTRAAIAAHVGVGAFALLKTALIFGV